MMKRCLYCYQPLEDYKQDAATIMAGNEKVIVPVKFLEKLKDLSEKEQEKILADEVYDKLLNKGNPEYHDTCVKKMFGTRQAPVVPYSLDEMAKLAKQVIERSVSVPGVQPKLSMSLEDQVNKENRLTIVGALGGSYIFKPPSSKYPEMPVNEHLTMLMTDIFGIRTAQSSLIRLQSGELSFIVKRMDRTPKGEKIHMQDMYQLSESYDKYKGTMERIAKVLDEYSAHPDLDKVNLLELAVFSFITGNADMHLKNFSLIELNEEWKLAPAYDLLNTKIVLREDQEEMALHMDGKKSGFRRKNFIRFGNHIGLGQRQTETAIDKFISRQDKALDLISISFLSDEFKEKYSVLFKDRVKRITS